MEKNLNMELGLTPRPWMIRKTLGPQEIFACALPSEEMEAYIIPNMGYDDIRVRLEHGVVVAVEDVVSQKTYRMELEGIFMGCLYYHLFGWSNLVKEKGLKPGDEIGICWDASSRKFKFHLLNVASLI